MGTLADIFCEQFVRCHETVLLSYAYIIYKKILPTRIFVEETRRWAVEEGGKCFQLEMRNTEIPQ